jgi:fluoroacetyl-CoA thioesterase
MINPFSSGDIRTFVHTVVATDTATFESGQVHPVYATFALARDAEWSGRLFVLEMKEEDEEGIGTALNIIHHSPALVGEQVLFTATMADVNKNEVITDFKATIGDRIVASGRQWQKILKKERLNNLFTSLHK